MVRLYAVKASLFSDPFAQFERLESAVECAIRINPEKAEELVVAIPVFKDCDFLEGDADEQGV